MVERDVVAARTREKVLKAATKLFAQKGLAGVPLRDIAKAAGVPLSTLAHHFSPKEKLQEAVIYRALDVITSESMRIELSGTPREQLHKYIERLVRLQLSDVPEIKLLDREFQSLNDDMISSLVLRSFKDNPASTMRLAEIIRSTGSDAIKSIEPWRLACILFSLIFGLIKLRPIHPMDPNAPLADAKTITFETSFIFERVLGID